MINDASNENTIKTYIQEYRNLDISYDTLHFLEKHDITENDNTSFSLIEVGDPIYSKYKTDLDEYITEKVLTQEEQRKYFYNPWALSKDLYGTTEFWHMLLELNNMYSAMEFTQEKIKVFTSSISSVIDSIMALEEDFINQNNDSLENDNITGESPSILYDDTDDYGDDEDYIEENNEE